MTFSTTIGSVTPGLIFLDQNAVSSGFSALGVSQYVLSTGTNTFTTTSHAPQLPCTGLVQQVSFPVTALPTLPLGNQTSVYNSGSLTASGTIQPLYTNSTLVIEWNITAVTQGSSVFFNLYEFTGPSPMGFSVVQYSNPGFAYIPSAGAVVGSWPYISPFTASLCAFSTNTASSSSFTGNFDSLIISEYNVTGNVPTSVSVTSTSATPVTLFTVVGASSTNVYINGSVAYFDSVQTAGSAQTFQMVLQTPSSGSSTLAFNNVAGNALAASPSLTFSITGNTLTVSVVGIAGKTFTCKANYIAVVS
jgi:hypothetical protein